MDHQSEEEKKRILDEIIAEFASPPPPQEPPVPKESPDSPFDAPPEREKVVAFPKRDFWGDDEEDEEEDEEEKTSLLDTIFAPPEKVEAEEDNTIDFPQPESSGLFSKLKGSLDRRADRMYEESDSIDDEEVRRREEYIPGTDEEEEVEPEPIRRPKKVAPPPPDTPPKELAARYHHGLFSLRVRGFLVFLLAIIALVPMFISYTVYELPPILTADPRHIYWFYAGALGLGALLSIDQLGIALWRGSQGKIGMDTMLVFSVFVSIADALYLSLIPNEQRPLPYCAINLLALWLMLHGAFEKRWANHMSCRTAGAAREPYIVTLDEKKWNARDTYCKWSGTPEGFGSQIQMDDGAQKIFSLVCPALLLGIAVSIIYRHGDIASSLWTATATLTATCAFGAPLCYGRASLKLEKRLNESGATIAGWAGAVNSRHGTRVLLTDFDLFPPGSINIKKPTYFQGYPDQTVMSYTAALLTATQCDLTPVFEHYIRAHGATPRLVKDPQFHEAGGVSARIWHDDVLVGSASFMNLMGVALPTGGHVPNMVFCAINGHLAGMFPVQYILPPTVSPAVYTLLSEGIAPILATRDFNLIPATLSGRFKLPAEHMDYPVIERRHELSDVDMPHNTVLTAIVSREGLLPFSEAVVGARRLRIVTRVTSIFCCVSSVIGLMLTSYLTSVGAYTSASPLHLLVFLGLWLMPVWLLTEWSHLY